MAARFQSSFYPLVFFVTISLFISSSTTATDSFRLWEPYEIVETLSVWKEQYPNLVKVSTSQHEYGLEQAGTSDDCPYDGYQAGCLNHFFTIQDYIAHPKGSESAASLPEILWTGSMHGDQQFGSAVVMEAAALLIEAATCEAKPSLDAKHWEREIEEAKACRSELQSKGIDETHRQWLARLVTTRRIVVVPNANALGQYRQKHLEGTVDPLDDFPYNNYSPESCMRTITARTMNELFLDHTFQIVLSFIEGEDKISYSWGSQSYLAPDHVAFHDIAESLSRTVGGEGVYPFAPSNSENKDIRTNFQDWAYAVSWENPLAKQCAPESFGGYDSSKTRYTAKSNRAVALTVSNNITTGDNLGNLQDVFHAKDDADNLDIARNMRLALVSADLVEPYVSIFGINSVSISEDIIPLTQKSGNICDTSRIVSVPHSLGTVIVEFTVGGGLDIQKTDLWVIREKDIPDSSVCSENLYDGFENLEDSFKKYPIHKKNNGRGFFSRSGPNPSPSDSVSKPFSMLSSSSHTSVSLTDTNSMGGLRDIVKNVNDDNNVAYATRSVNLLGPVFRTEIDLKDYEVGDRLILIAGATIDQNWKESPVKYHHPLVPPQSHLANMRTNPHYKYTKDGKLMEGRLSWLSIPVTVVVKDIDKLVGGIELYKRFDQNNGYAKPVGRPNSISSNGNSKNSSFTVWMTLGISVGFFVSVVSCCHFFVLAWRTRRRKIRALACGGDGMFKTTADNDSLPVNYDGDDKFCVEGPKEPSVSDLEYGFSTRETKPSDISVNVDLDNAGSLDDVDLDSAILQSEPV